MSRPWAAYSVLLLTASLVLPGASWIDPHAKAREAARLYATGDFDAARTKYNEALVDDPDSTLLHYNLGASAYKSGKFEEAISAYVQTPGADIADVAYNIGNAKYRLGAAAEATEPEKALGLYAEAIAAYRRSMGADPADEDAKLNHELVTKKIEELQRKLEEQKKEQEQQQEQDPQQGDQQQDDQQQDPSQDQERAEEQEQPGEQEEAQPDQQQGSEGDSQDAEQAQPSAPGEGEAKDVEQAAPQPSEPSERESGAEQGQAVAGEPQRMSEQEAKALLDAARDQEARPEEITRRRLPAGVLEPAEDW